LAEFVLQTRDRADRLHTTECDAENVLEH